MSTRGAIARPTATGWEGRYVHHDSYPTGLGRTLWQLYHRQFSRNLPVMLNFFIDAHPAGWSSINGADFNLTPGFTEHTNTRYGDIRAGLLTYKEYRALPQNRRPHCYCHGDRSEGPHLLTGTTADPLFIGWVYILGPLSLTVLAGMPTTWDDPAVAHQRREPWMTIPYKHVVVGVFDLAGPEPDWEALSRHAMDQQDGPQAD